MGWFSNAINSVSNVFSGARNTISNVWSGVKDTANTIAHGFDWVGSTLDKISNSASSIPFVGTAIQEGISDLRLVTDFDGIHKWVTDHNNMLQNNPYEGMVSDLADKIQSGINMAQQYAPQVEGALQKVGIGV